MYNELNNKIDNKATQCSNTQINKLDSKKSESSLGSSVFNQENMESTARGVNENDNVETELCSDCKQVNIEVEECGNTEVKEKDSANTKHCSDGKQNNQANIETEECANTEVKEKENAETEHCSDGKQSNQVNIEIEECGNTEVKEKENAETEHCSDGKRSNEVNIDTEECGNTEVKEKDSANTKHCSDGKQSNEVNIETEECGNTEVKEKENAETEHGTDGKQSNQVNIETDECANTGVKEKESAETKHCSGGKQNNQVNIETEDYANTGVNDKENAGTEDCTDGKQSNQMNIETDECANTGVNDKENAGTEDCTDGKQSNQMNIETDECANTGVNDKEKGIACCLDGRINKRDDKEIKHYLGTGVSGQDSEKNQEGKEEAEYCSDTALYDANKETFSVIEVKNQESEQEVQELSNQQNDQSSVLSNDSSSCTELQLLSLIADTDLILPNEIAKEIEEILASRGMKRPQLYKELVPLDTLNENIISMIQHGGPKTIGEYEKQLGWKHECVWLQVKAFCSLVRSAIPYVVKCRAQGFLFCLEGLKPCFFNKTACEILWVNSTVSENNPEELVMRGGFNNRNNIVAPEKVIHSERMRHLYVKMMTIICSSEFPLYDYRKAEGFWKNFRIRINSVGQSMLVVIVSSSDPRNFECSLLMTLLNKQFTEDDVDFLILEIHVRSECVRTIVLGEGYLTELVGDMVLNLYPQTWWSNPAGVLQLCEVITDVARLDETWVVIQLGLEYDAVSLYIAKRCGVLHVIHSTEVFENENIIEDLLPSTNYLTENASLNKVSNIQYHSGPVVKIFGSIIKSYELSSNNICVIVPEFISFEETIVSLLKDGPNVKKIICLSEFTDPSFINNVVSLCASGEHGSENHFVIKDIIPVDLSPWENLVKTVTLLCKSLVEIEPNVEFSEIALKEYFSMKDSLKKGRLDQICNLIEPFVATREEKCIFDKTLKFPWKYKHDCQCFGGSNINKKKSDHYPTTQLDDSERLCSQAPSMGTDVVDSSELVEFAAISSKIDEIISSGIPITSQQCRYIFSLKEKMVKSQLSSLSDSVKQFLPSVLITKYFLPHGDLMFALQNITMCPLVPTLCERICIPLGKSYSDPLGVCYNHIVGKCRTVSAVLAFDLLMQCIQKSQIPVYDSNTNCGFWDSCLIRTNSVGDVWLMVEGREQSMVDQLRMLSDLVPLLQECFTADVPRNLKIVSLNLKISVGNFVIRKVVLGDMKMEETVGGIRARIDCSNELCYNPHGIQTLCNVILDSAGFDDTWSVLQLNTYCLFETLHIAQICKWLYFLKSKDYSEIDLMIGNRIKNIVCVVLDDFMVNEIKTCENLCVVEYLNNDSVGVLQPAHIRKYANIKKIIYISELSYSDWNSKLKDCCLKNDSFGEPFIIQKFVAIDMSPFDNHLVLVCFLIRESLVPAQLQVRNAAYSELEVAKYLEQFKSATPRTDEDMKVKTQKNKKRSRKRRWETCLPEKTEKDSNIPSLIDEPHAGKIPSLLSVDINEQEIFSKLNTSNKIHTNTEIQRNANTLNLESDFKDEPYDRVKNMNFDEKNTSTITSTPYLAVSGNTQTHILNKGFANQNPINCVEQNMLPTPTYTETQIPNLIDSSEHQPMYTKHVESSLQRPIISGTAWRGITSKSVKTENFNSLEESSEKNHGVEVKPLVSNCMTFQTTHTETENTDESADTSQPAFMTNIIKQISKFSQNTQIKKGYAQARQYDKLKKIPVKNNACCDTSKILAGDNSTRCSNYGTSEAFSSGKIMMHNVNDRLTVLENVSQRSVYDVNKRSFGDRTAQGSNYHVNERVSFRDQTPQRSDYYVNERLSLGEQTAQHPGYYANERLALREQTAQHPDYYANERLSLGEQTAHHPDYYANERLSLGEQTAQHPDYYANERLSLGEQTAQRPGYYANERLALREQTAQHPGYYANERLSLREQTVQHPGYYANERLSLGGQTAQHPDYYANERLPLREQTAQHPDYYANERLSLGEQTAQCSDYNMSHRLPLGGPVIGSYSYGNNETLSFGNVQGPRTQFKNLSTHTNLIQDYKNNFQHSFKNN